MEISPKTGPRPYQNIRNKGRTNTQPRSASAAWQSQKASRGDAEPRAHLANVAGNYPPPLAGEVPSEPFASEAVGGIKTRPPFRLAFPLRARRASSPARGGG